MRGLNTAIALCFLFFAAFVTVKLVDKNGTLVPVADNLIKFELSRRTQNRAESF